MPPSDRPASRNRRRIVGRALLYTVLFALLLVAVWLVGANYVLGFSGEGPAADWINRKPEKFALHWQEARTLVPGRVSLRGVTLRGQNRHVQWWASLDRAEIDLVVPELLGKEVHIRSGSAEGVRFRLRRRVPEAADRIPHEPPIPGLDNPPARAPEDLYPESPDGPGWRVLLDRVHLDGVREIWIENPRFAGDGSLKTAMDFRIRGGGLTLKPFRLRLDGGLRTGPAEPQITDLTVALDAVVDDLDPGSESGWEQVEAFSGELTLAGDVRSLSLVDRFLPDLPGFTLDGHGRLTSRLVLDAGQPQPGTELSLDAAAVRIGLSGYLARGRGTVEGRLRDAARNTDDPGVGADVSVRLAEYDLSRPEDSAAAEDPEPYLFGRDLRLDLDVAHLPFGPPADPEADDGEASEILDGVRAVLEIPPATVPDLTVYNAYLPPALGARITGGGGRLQGRFELDGGGRGSGELHLVSPDLAGTYDGLRLTGEVTVDTALPAVDLEAGRFDLGGSVVRLRKLRVVDDGTAQSTGWWARVDVPAGTLRPGGEPLLDARIAARMRDSGPLLALFARKKAVVGWFDDLLTVEGVTAGGRVGLGATGVRLRGVELEGDGLEILADLRLSDSSKTGYLYARRGPFRVAARLTGNDVDWRLRRPLRWYRDRVGGSGGPS